MKDKKYHERINHEIRFSPVRVIDENGDSLGVIATQEALKIAQSRNLDLVEISPNSKPPVCKIVDYGKYNYERQKKEKLAKKNQTVMHIKEIRFNPNTDKHDLEFKTKHIRQFLAEGHKIKVAVFFRGRMITHPEIGKKLMEEVLAKIEDIAKVEAPPKMEGKTLIAYVSPDKNKIQALKKEESGSKPAEKKNEKPVVKPAEKSAEKPAEEITNNNNN